MKADFDKLFPAPWHSSGPWVNSARGMIAFIGSIEVDRQTDEEREAHAAFFALARNAFDAMVKFGMEVHRHFFCEEGGWYIMWYDKKAGEFRSSRMYADPFTALVAEAEKLQ